MTNTWSEIDMDQLRTITAKAFESMQDEKLCSLCREEPKMNEYGFGVYCRNCHDIVCGFSVNEHGECSMFCH